MFLQLKLVKIFCQYLKFRFRSVVDLVGLTFINLDFIMLDNGLPIVGFMGWTSKCGSQSIFCIFSILRGFKTFGALVGLILFKLDFLKLDIVPGVEDMWTEIQRER